MAALAAVRFDGAANVGTALTPGRSMTALAASHFADAATSAPRARQVAA